MGDCTFNALEKRQAYVGYILHEHQPETETEKLQVGGGGWGDEGG